MPGFGQAPFARYGSAVPGFISSSSSDLVPSSEWTGVAASGFSIIPTDPARTTAKPAVRLLVPPGQFFTDKLVIGVAAAANDGGTLVGGVDRVRFRFEGNTLDVVAPSLRTFSDANGNAVTYFGYWATLKKPDGLTGDAQLYVEAVPSDAAMQSRVIGPYSFYLEDTLHDKEYTVDPDAAITATNFASFDAAMVQVRSDAPDNPRITFKKALTNQVMSFAAVFTPKGYITVESDFPVSFGRTALTTGPSVDLDSNLRPGLNALWLKGANITIDFAYVDNLFAESGKSYVLDGINMTNSRGQNALWRGGPHATGGRVRGSPYYLETNITNVEYPCLSASLVRGGTITNVSHDIFTDSKCLVGTRVNGHSDAALTNDSPAFSVVYDGVEATATISRLGAVDPTNCTYEFKYGANTQTFSTGRLATYYAGTVGDGYLFGDLVDWINGTLAALDAGWSATLLDTKGHRASSGTLAGLKAQGFGDTNCKTTPLTVSTSFDAHGDWYQQLFGTNMENVIAYDNIATGMQTQNIFLSSNVGAKDSLFFNNALGNDPVPGDYWDADIITSQLGRSSNATAFSHVVIAHCSMPNQRITIRNDGSSVSTFDGYCLIANNAVSGIIKVNPAAIGMAIKDNHAISTAGLPAEATGTTTGGTYADLFGDFNAGDFSPAGALLTNLKAPVVTRDLNGATRAALAAAGPLV